MEVEIKQLSSRNGELEKKHAQLEANLSQLLDIEKKYRQLLQDHESQLKELNSCKEAVRRLEESAAKAKLQMTILQKDNQDLRDFYEKWQMQRDELVLAMQREEAIAQELRRESSDKSFKNMQLLIRVGMLASELDRLHKKKPTR